MALRTVSLKEAHQERREDCSIARAGLPSANDELLFLDALDLEPGRVTARAVWSSCGFSYEAFKIEVTSSQEEGRTSPGHTVSDKPATTPVKKDNKGQTPPADLGAAKDTIRAGLEG